MKRLKKLYIKSAYSDNAINFYPQAILMTNLLIKLTNEKTVFSEKCHNKIRF